MNQTIKPLLLACSGSAFIEYISTSQFEVIFKYFTQIITVIVSIFYAYKNYKNNKK